MTPPATATLYSQVSTASRMSSADRPDERLRSMSAMTCSARKGCFGSLASNFRGVCSIATVYPKLPVLSSCLSVTREL